MERKPGTYYLEADPAPWTWALGDGVCGEFVCYAAPRREFWGDPAASLTIGEMLPDGLVQGRQFANSRWPEKGIVYERLTERLGTMGLFIPVPAHHWSAAEFVYRTETYGPALPVKRMEAVRAARLLPLTVIYTHRRLPLFRDDYHRRGALALAEELTFSTGVVDATWLRPDWGMEPDDDKGDDHYMRAVLRVIQRLDWEWKGPLTEREEWRRARQFFGATPMAGQPFGAGRIMRVVYVATGREPEDRLAADAELGIEIEESVTCTPS